MASTTLQYIFVYKETIFKGCGQILIFLRGPWIDL